MTSETNNTKSQVDVNAKIDANSVGWYFAKKYYTTLNQEPAVMHCFYSKTSSCIHGVEGDRVAPAVGNSDINKLFSSSSFNNCKVRLSNIESIDLADNLILVQSIGEMANEGQKYRRFVQTFLLERNGNTYYCKNDILRYLKDYNGKDATTSVEAWKENENDATETKTYEMPTPTHSEQPTVEAGASKTNQDIKPSAGTQYKSADEPSSYKMPEPIHNPQESVTPAAAEEPAPSFTTSNITMPEAPAAKEAPKPTQPAGEPQVHQKPAASGIKSWAGLAATNQGAWGNAVSSIPGLAVAASPAPQQSSTHVTSQSSGNKNAPPVDRNRPPRRRENFPIYIKNIPAKADVPLLKKAFEKFGGVSHVEILNSGNAVIDFIAADSQKNALSSRTMNLDLGGSIPPTQITIEERRTLNGNRENKGGRNPSRGSNDYDRSSSSRGRTGGRPRNVNSK
ncbi:putative G3BP-like protein [Smittium mucronatum]|uniref:Putative G3BP-like protein n=1 Tax=Smittium mucronatum TaxID=133383 RepID=A0A1R0H491_9FUNG|nr:putative G3BP-like protein [Smittium mucronatum]